MGINTSCPCHKPSDDRVFVSGEFSLEYERVNGVPVINFGSLMLVRSVYLAVICRASRYCNRPQLSAQDVAETLRILLEKYGKDLRDYQVPEALLKTGTKILSFSSLLNRYLA